MSSPDGEDEILSTVKLECVKGQQRIQQLEQMDTDNAIQGTLDCVVLNASSETGEPITLALRDGKSIPQHYDACVKELDETKHVPIDAISEENQQDMIENPDGQSQKTEDDISIKSEPLSNISAFGRGLDDISTYDKHSKPLSSRHSTPKQYKPSMKLPTPREKALFKTLPKKVLTRKRKQNPDKWKRNVNKRLKLSGTEYTDTRGQVRKAKNMQRVDCSKCKFKYSQHIDEEKRQELFDEFYALESYERQKDFVCANTREKSTITILGEDDKPIPKKRSTARSYSFCVDGCRRKVCKTFFRTTLAVSVSYIEHALRNSGHGSFTGSDKRGHHSPGNKTNFAQRERVRSHIETFPAVDPNYTRKDSNRKYLDQGLSIRKMFALYKEECVLNGNKPVTHGIYRQIFTKEFNLSFHKPKKDKCLLCSHYNKELSDKGHVNTNLEKEYEDHQTRNVQAREEKEEDKQKAKSSNNLNVATFDLQAVLSTPCSLVSQGYYKRKLSSYNLSVYSLGDGEGYNYVWDETEGKRGSSEISTCLYLYLSSLASTVDTVTFYSDPWYGQYRKQNIASALHHAVTNIPNIKVINQKFLETGHAQTECDSMQSTIEYAKKRISLYVPRQWDTLIQLAHQKKPYKVIPLQHTHFWNFKKVGKKLKKAKVDTCGKEVRWLQIKWLQFRKDEPDTIYFKYSFADENFREMKLPSSFGRGRPVLESQKLEKLYQDQLPISVAKKRDLLSLCNSRVIPEVYHEYYENLKTDSGCLDCLPEPDEQEEDIDTDN